ncbi:MAG TPA: hypothetical protein VND65_01800 [Candidatus Binatia bacterium]|nr:hypothetical protein [Candidatus Binatia bacterium]
MTNERRRAVIKAALQSKDLNEACKKIQDALGVNDGGTASVFFSGKILLDDEWQKALSEDRRRELLIEYLNLELFYLAGGEDEKGDPN